MKDVREAEVNGRNGPYKSWRRSESYKSDFFSLLTSRSSYNWIYNPANVIFVSEAAEELYCKFALIHPSEGPIWQIIHLAHCTLSRMAWIPHMINRFLLRLVSFNPQQGQNNGEHAARCRLPSTGPLFPFGRQRVPRRAGWRHVSFFQVSSVKPLAVLHFLPGKPPERTDQRCALHVTGVPLCSPPWLQTRASPLPNQGQNPHWALEFTGLVSAPLSRVYV